MNRNLEQQLALLPGYLAAHVLVAGSALLIGVCLSLPLGLGVARRPTVRRIVLSAAAVVQTIPSLALLALMVPLLGMFGFWPALVALVLYSMLPILSTTVAGLSQVDASVVEAARGLGMTDRQVLRKVELPLALPVIVAGVRTAAVWVVGTATLSTPVGQPSLGNYIFSGLQTRNWTAVLVGCTAAAGLALLVDALLSVMTRGVSRRKLNWTLGATAALGCLFLGAAWMAFRPLPMAKGASEGQDTATLRPATNTPRRAAHDPVKIGAKTFTEQYILAAAIDQLLTQAQIPTARIESLGSAVAFDALAHGDIDVYVDYTGTLYTNVLKHGEREPAWRVRARCTSELADKYKIRLLGALGFENAYALAMRRDHAASLGVQSITDLALHAQGLSLGSDYEFLQRPEWAELKASYRLNFEQTRSFDSTFMYSAVRDREVDVITAFSSDGRIAAYDLVVLEDDHQAFPPYEAVLLLSPKVADDQAVVRALAPVIDALSVQVMQHANGSVDRETAKQTVQQAATWLLTQLK